jgi:hypothetical protein
MLIQGNFQEKPIRNHGSAKGQKKHNLTLHDPRAFSDGIKRSYRREWGIMRQCRTCRTTAPTDGS